MLICILTKNVITSCSVTMMLFLHLEVKPLMTLTSVLYLFFSTSRRRHTRFDCDWSSDVCSSDLVHKFSVDEKARSPAHPRLGPFLHVLLNLGLELPACQAGLERFFIQPERLGSFDQTGFVELGLIRQQCIVILPELSLFFSAATRFCRELCLWVQPT